MRYILTFALLLGFNLSYGCMCEDFPDSSNIDEWIDETDVIVEGEYIADVGWGNSDSNNYDVITEGVNIYFQVKKIIKGSLNSDTIVINQWGNGNCTMIFKKGKKYIVFAHEIKGFESLSEEYYQKYDSTDNIPPQPPLDFVDENKILKTYYSDSEEVNYWNRIATRHQVFFTSSCSTFSSSPGLKKMLRK